MTKAHGDWALPSSGAIFLEPVLAGVYNISGTVYSRLGLGLRAVGDFGKAIRLDTAFEGAYANRALAHAGLGEEVEMRRDVEVAVSLGSAAPR